MDYQIMPVGEIWQGGMACIPQALLNNYIKLASEYQLKSLLMIFSLGGAGSSREIAKKLGLAENDVNDFLDFWVEEGVLVRNAQPADVIKVQEKPAQPSKPALSTKRLESLPVPTFSPSDIVALLRENDRLTQLMNSAQEVLGRILSHADQEMIINMVDYYGLPEEVVLTILHYYKTQREKGRALGVSYVVAMAKNWSDEGISTLSAADEKLRELESSDRLWNEIVALTGIRHRNPTVKQREMIKSWSDDFNIEMISLACDAMKENAEKPSLNYVDKVLKNWRKKGIKTPSDVISDNEKHIRQRESKGNLDSKSTYNISEIEKNAIYDDNYDV